MELEKFKEILKGCKRSEVYGTQNLKLKSDQQKNYFKILEEPKEKICSKCGTDLKKDVPELIIHFNNEQKSLTVFEVEMLWYIFKHNKVPADYAKYHECIAGKEFIENIKEVEK